MATVPSSPPSRLRHLLLLTLLVAVLWPLRPAHAVCDATVQQVRELVAARERGDSEFSIFQSLEGESSLMALVRLEQEEKLPRGFVQKLIIGTSSTDYNTSSPDGIQAIARACVLVDTAIHGEIDHNSNPDATVGPANTLIGNDIIRSVNSLGAGTTSPSQSALLQKVLEVFQDGNPRLTEVEFRVMLHVHPDNIKARIEKLEQAKNSTEDEVQQKTFENQIRYLKNVTKQMIRARIALDTIAEFPGDNAATYYKAHQPNGGHTGTATLDMMTALGNPDIGYGKVNAEHVGLRGSIAPLDDLSEGVSTAMGNNGVADNSLISELRLDYDGTAFEPGKSFELTVTRNAVTLGEGDSTTVVAKPPIVKGADVTNEELGVEVDTEWVSEGSRGRPLSGWGLIASRKGIVRERQRIHPNGSTPKVVNGSGYAVYANDGNGSTFLAFWEADATTHEQSAKDPFEVDRPEGQILQRAYLLKDGTIRSAVQVTEQDYGTGYVSKAEVKQEARLPDGDGVVVLEIPFLTENELKLDALEALDVTTRARVAKELLGRESYVEALSQMEGPARARYLRTLMTAVQEITTAEEGRDPSEQTVTREQATKILKNLTDHDMFVNAFSEVTNEGAGDALVAGLAVADYADGPIDQITLSRNVNQQVDTSGPTAARIARNLMSDSDAQASLAAWLNATRSDVSGRDRTPAEHRAEILDALLARGRLLPSEANNNTPEVALEGVPEFIQAITQAGNPGSLHNLEALATAPRFRAWLSGTHTAVPVPADQRRVPNERMVNMFNSIFGLAAANPDSDAYTAATAFYRDIFSDSLRVRSSRDRPLGSRETADGWDYSGMHRKDRAKAASAAQGVGTFVLTFEGAELRNMTFRLMRQHTNTILDPAYSAVEAASEVNGTSSNPVAVEANRIAVRVADAGRVPEIFFSYDSSVPAEQKQSVDTVDKIIEHVDRDRVRREAARLEQSNLGDFNDTLWNGTHAQHHFSRGNLGEGLSRGRDHTRAIVPSVGPGFSQSEHDAFTQVLEQIGTYNGAANVGALDAGRNETTDFETPDGTTLAASVKSSNADEIGELSSSVSGWVQDMVEFAEDHNYTWNVLHILVPETSNITEDQVRVLQHQYRNDTNSDIVIVISRMP